MPPPSISALSKNAPCKNAPSKNTNKQRVLLISHKSPIFFPHCYYVKDKNGVNYVPALTITFVFFIFRKVIVLITDAEQHYAMDGILGGIMNNFDTNSCKTKKGQLPTTPGNFDIRNLYTEEQNFDYPSFGEVKS